MMLWLRDLMDRFDQLSLRERVLVLGAALGLILLVWESLFMTPLEREGRTRRQHVEGLRAEVAGLERSAESLVTEGSADPDTATRAAIDKLKLELAGLDQRLAGATSGLIEPREMARVLEQMLARATKVRLLALRTLPPEAIVAPLAGDAAVTEGALRAGSAQVWRHGVEIEVGATYIETLQLLQALEALPWRFFWERAEFSVTEHPQGRAKLRLYTLGLEEGWIGV
jgi:MSHA biogenesis protein MshJ